MYNLITITLFFSMAIFEFPWLDLKTRKVNPHLPDIPFPQLTKASMNDQINLQVGSSRWVISLYLNQQT